MEGPGYEHLRNFVCFQLSKTECFGCCIWQLCTLNIEFIRTRA
jgi:hypothetical protein